jgi:hypothetical protein
VVDCDGCAREFKTVRALKIHAASCSPERVAEASARYMEGESSAEIAPDYGVTPQAVLNWLHDVWNVVVRRPGTPRASVSKRSLPWYERGTCPLHSCGFEGDGEAVLAHALDAHGLTKTRVEPPPRRCRSCGDPIPMSTFKVHECSSAA